MDDKRKLELIELIQKEIDRCQKNYLHYGQLIHRTLPIVLTIIISVFILGVDREIDLLITLFPLIFISVCSLMQSVFLSAFAADSGIRIYEEALNTVSKSNIYFLHKDLHEVFHSHKNKIGWSPQSYIIYMITFGVSILPYIYSITEGEEWLRQNHGKAISFFYVLLTISLPILVLNSFIKLKKRMNNELTRIKQSDLFNRLKSEESR